MDGGLTRQNVSEQLEIGKDTVRKAINDGRLMVGQNEAFNAGQGSTKSLRNASDALAADGMGTACTRVMDRVFASLGEKDGTETRFESCLDVSNAGVLCALPALLANGLLDGVEKFLGKIKGYYTMLQILLLIAYRSETAMISLLKSATVDSSEARGLLQDLFATEADILPEAENNILRVRVHNASRPAANRSYDKLFEKLNETNTRYPGTDMRIVYELVK